MKIFISHKLTLWIAIVGLIALFMIAIWICYWIAGFTKHVSWQRGNIRAEGVINPKTKEREFYRIYLGDPEVFLEAGVPIAIESPNGEKIAFSNLTAEKIKNMLNTKYDTSYSTITGYSGKTWPENTTFYTVLKPDPDPNIKLSYNAYSFAIKDGNVIGVIIFDEGCYGLWDINLGKKYNFPLSQMQIEEIFGKPDKVKIWTPLIEL